MQSFSLGPYQVDVQRRRFQKSLTLRVPSLGRLKVCCGSRVPLREIVRFIEDRIDFVERCHQTLQKQKSLSPLQSFESGERCPFLGQDRELNVRRLEGIVRSRVKLDGAKILVELPEGDSVQVALQKFFKKSGSNYLSHLVQVRSQQMGLFPSRLSFRSQRTRWGSCSSEGSVSLNWRLIAGSHEVMDYVVVHELAHLKHQDHSPRFWNLVKEHCPDYLVQKKWLKENHYLFDFLTD